MSSADPAEVFSDFLADQERQAGAMLDRLLELRQQATGQGQLVGLSPGRRAEADQELAVFDEQIALGVELRDLMGSMRRSWLRVLEIRDG